jgi:hypothetical protein
VLLIWAPFMPWATNTMVAVLDTIRIGTLAAFGLAHEEQGRNTLHAHTIIYIDLWNEVLKAFHSSQCSSRDAAPAEAHNIALVDSILKLLACDAVNTPPCNFPNLQQLQHQASNSYLPQLAIRIWALIGCWLGNN